VSKRIAQLIFAASVATCQMSGVYEALAFEQVEVGPPPTRVLDLVVGVSRLVSTANPFASVDIADPNIVDAKPETDKTVLLIPKASGNTTIYFFDEKKMVESSFIVRVASTASPEIKPNYIQSGRVKLHNVEPLGGVTLYQCSQNNCELEQLAPLPAPAPTVPPPTDIRTR
jgi:Flp pilus assembly secretin CpaC